VIISPESIPPSTRPAGLRVVLALLALLAAASLGGCDRLNPDWCEKGLCAAGEYCDPTTNTCRSREAGAPDGSGDQSVEAGRDGLTDQAPADLAADQPPAHDGTIDLKVD